MNDKADTFEHLVEPPYDVQRGAALNERAGEHDLRFKKLMDDARAKVSSLTKTRKRLQT
jgi:hypothetical protein